MDDKERNKNFRAERRERLKDRPRLLRETRAEIIRLLEDAQARIREALNTAPSDWEQWYLPQLQQAVRKAMNEFSASGSAVLASKAGEAWQAGIDFVDRPIEAGGIRISAVLPTIDPRQLNAMRTFMTDRIHDIGTSAANRVNSELGLVVIGSQDTGTAIGNIATILEKGGRSRALTVIRTELGRTYSVAKHERELQAKEFLPGLKKQWRRSGKVHSRVAHDAADGQVQDVEERFIVGGVPLMFPRDPKAPAKETINCGCESLPFMEHWEVQNPGKQPFSDLELQSPLKQALQDARPLAEVVADAP